MSNKVFKRILLICFLVVLGSIITCLFSYYIFDTGRKVTRITDKYFYGASSFEDGDRALVIEIPYSDDLTEKMLLNGVRNICYGIQAKNININKRMLIFNVYDYEKLKKTYVYVIKIQDSILYNTDWLGITKYEELKFLIKR